MRHSTTKRRRVYYATDEFYRAAKTAAAILDESITEFVSVAIRERIDRQYSPDQQRIIFHPKSPA